MSARRLRRNLRVIAFLLILLMQVSSVVAMGAPPGGFSDQQAGDACGTACGSFLFMIVVIFALNIALLVWVAKDAKNRGMGSAVGWVFLILFTSFIGLIIYLFSRPSGNLVVCEFCRNKKMMAARICPHCGNSALPAANSVGNRVDITVTAPGPTPVVPSADSTGQAKYCTNCGGKVSSDAIFCEECGNKI